jgi:acetyl-CoA acetyltransferase
MAKKSSSSTARRVAIVGGLRTPFVKAGTAFAELSALDLGRLVVQELVQRCDLDGRQEGKRIERRGFGFGEGIGHTHGGAPIQLPGTVRCSIR